MALKDKLITELPAWTKHLKDDSLLNSRDVSNLFNLDNKSPTHGVINAIKAGIIPEPTTILFRRFVGKDQNNARYKSKQWTFKSLKDQIRLNKQKLQEK